VDSLVALHCLAALAVVRLTTAAPPELVLSHLNLARLEHMVLETMAVRLVATMAAVVVVLAQLEELVIRRAGLQAQVVLVNNGQMAPTMLAAARVQDVLDIP
jgi:hypothetical protein